jgi:hypothetical protein
MKKGNKRLKVTHGLEFSKAKHVQDFSGGAIFR